MHGACTQAVSMSGTPWGPTEQELLTDVLQAGPPLPSPAAGTSVRHVLSFLPLLQVSV